MATEGTRPAQVQEAMPVASSAELLGFGVDVAGMQSEDQGAEAPKDTARSVESTSGFFGTDDGDDGDAADGEVEGSTGPGAATNGGSSPGDAISRAADSDTRQQQLQDQLDARAKQVDELQAQVKAAEQSRDEAKSQVREAQAALQEER